jgi:phenylacetate-CoA ligase
MWEKTGWKGDIRAVIRNRHLEPKQVFSVDPIKKEVIFDGFKTDDAYYEKIYNILKLYNIQFIHAYPSSAYQFCVFLKKKNKDTSFIKGFLCGSEGLTELQRQLISNDLQISIYNWYGHSEKLVLGGPCKYNDATHVEPTYGYFELIDGQGNNIKKEGQVGEIVGTSLHNPYMPLVRYRTGDFAEYAGDYCPHCKRYLPLIRKIQGRWNKNKIYLSDGTYVSITALNLHSELYAYINGMQYVQNKKGFLQIYLVKGKGFSDTVESRFQEHFNLSFADKCEYEIIYRERLIKEENGKFLQLRQLIKD